MDADFRGVEHGDAENVAGARRAGADDLGEEGDADAHQLARLAALERLALCFLLFAQLLVADRLHRLVHGGVIVAGIVLPAERRRVGELLAADQVLHAEFGRVHAELLRHDVHGALDAIGRFGDAERAAIGDAARRLVGIDAVDQTMRGREVVGAADDAEQPGRPFGGVGAGVEGAVVGDGVAAHRRHTCRPWSRRSPSPCGSRARTRWWRGSRCGPRPISPARPVTIEATIAQI